MHTTRRNTVNDRSGFVRRDRSQDHGTGMVRSGILSVRVFLRRLAATPVVWRSGWFELLKRRPMCAIALARVDLCHAGAAPVPRGDVIPPESGRITALSRLS